jgi:ABC-type Fe3+ transport system substrate-binding protein
MSARLIFVTLIGTTTVLAGEIKVPWQMDWEKIIAEARREGQLGIVAEETYLPVMEDFKKRYPWIGIAQMGGGSGRERTQKLMAERRANLYLRDVYIGSPWSNLAEGTYQVCDPMKSALILPEVVDQSKWWKGKHHYEDPKGQYIFVFEGVIKSGDIVYNKNLVNPENIRSYWDLLNAKWKGKVVATDHNPRAVGAIGDGWRLFYFHPGLGREFLKRFYGEMDITLSRNQVQMLDWLAVGKVALAFFTSTTEVENAIRQGLPIANFFAPNFKEGGIVNPYVGRMCLLNRGPHPNAAKLFVNWILSREGQISFQNAFVPRTQGQQGNSMREDIPKDIIPPPARREACVDCLEYTHEMLDIDAILKLVNEAYATAKR